MKVKAIFVSAFLVSSLLNPAEATAQTFKSIPATKWVHVYGSGESSNLTTSQPSRNIEIGPPRSSWKVEFIDVPSEAKPAFQRAIDIWASHFESTVSIEVEAHWEPSTLNGVLGSARPGGFFNAFDGAPDGDLWYPSALANRLAKKDLAPDKPEIVLRFNSNALWHFGLDGKPAPFTYDLSSTVLHEIGHGLGFISNAEYDQFFGTGYIVQPTPYDAYVQLIDGKVFSDFCARSIELGKAMTSMLSWSGRRAIEANGGVKPQLYSTKIYEDGSSITHLDEDLFARGNQNSVMTPVIEPGEVFSSPGPIALAMIEDMLQQPPANLTTKIPAKPLNVKAFVGDKYALVTFDSPTCRRIDRVTGYKVTVTPGGQEKTFKSSPARISGLVNGKSYSFAVVAQNATGISESVTSNEVKPQSTPKAILIDKNADARYIATGIFKGNSVIAYSDATSGNLKLAQSKGRGWRISIIDGNSTSSGRSDRNLSGPLSLCVSGVGKSQILHVFYSDMENLDLRHAIYDGKRWKFEVVDGNGESVQNYKEFPRQRTASNVSVSNACAVTSAGVQVFYRDETQGILLGATLSKSGWVYEIVDGDRETDGRTTGDVGFTLSATSIRRSVYLIYDSVLSLSSSNIATQGEVRLAKRDSIFPEDWSYQTLDGPNNGAAVAGYEVSLASYSNKVAASWLSASGNRVPNPDQIKFMVLNEDEEAGVLESNDLGNAGSPLLVDPKGLFFGCEKRLCAIDSYGVSKKLLSGSNLGSNKKIATVIVQKNRYLVASINKKLVSYKL